MDTYVVRIYRLPNPATGLVLGVVERVGENGLRRFSNFDELREILTQGKAAGLVAGAGADNAGAEG